MLRQFRWLAAALLAALVCPAAPAAPVIGLAGDSPLAVVPAQSPIVVQVRGLDRVKGRMNALLKEIAPPLAPIAAATLESKIEDLLDGGRKLEGLDKNGPIFIALLEMPSPEAEIPAMAIIAKVTKYSEF